MKSPIVIGVDGSAQALDAIALGRVLSESLDHPVLLASCYGSDLGALPRGLGVYEQALREAALRQLDEALKGLYDVPVFGARAVSMRSAVRGLAQVAEDTSAIAVVVGSSHRGAVGQTMAGSVGERLIQAAPCAVAIAPRTGVKETRFSAVGVAYDASPEAHSALLAAATVAASSGARLRIISVLQPPNPANPLFAVTGQGYTEIVKLMRAAQIESLARGAADVARDDMTVDTELLEGDVIAELLKQSESLDLLTLGSRGYGAVRRVAAGAVSIGVLRGAACPVLVLPRGVDDPFGYAKEQAGEGAQGDVRVAFAGAGSHAGNRR
jgi:nucleotide-binding universal stress UspA family protein